MKSKLTVYWSKFLVFSIIILTIYSYRFVFFKNYDLPYLEDFYHNSQWVVPLSPRIMGDGELYSFVAGKLIQGNNPFDFAPEVPLLGKYLYGFSILIVNNPLIVSVLLYISVVYIFYLYTKKIYKQTTKINLLTVIFASSALLITQIQDTVMDLPHLFFLISHLLTILYFDKDRKIKLFSFLPILSGMLLGAFAATKVPLLVPIILIYDAFVLSKNKHLNKLIPIILFGLVIYIGSYIQFFLQYGSIMDWIKNQLWILNFYKNSTAPRQPLSTLLSIPTGYLYQEKIIKFIPEWNFTWPLGFILIFKKFKKQKPEKAAKIKNIKILLTTLILFFLLTPFSKRYILILIPFFILLIGQIKNKTILYFLTFIQVLHFSFFIQQETLKPMINFQTRIENQRYQDAYEYLTKESKEKISRDLFTATLRKVDQDLEVSKIDVKLKPPSIFSTKQQLTSNFSISRYTPIGNYQLTKDVNLIKQNNQWLVEWDWEVVSPKFSPENTLLLTIDKVYGGTLSTADNKQLSWSSEKNNRYLFILGIEDKDDPLLQHVSNITGINRETVRSKAYVLSDIGAKVPIGFIIWNPKQESLDYVIDSHNIVLEERITRTYPDGLLHGNYLSRIQKIEKQYPQLFPTVGGEINLKIQDKTIPIFKSISKSGENVKLNQRVDEVLDKNAILML